ncbi:hypothetical protein TNCV_1261341 [Trichonephila clavipes]|nr:hypothetical protein TNCV_1261341 [Trichonephila clavipes]
MSHTNLFNRYHQQLQKWKQDRAPQHTPQRTLLCMGVRSDTKFRYIRCKHLAALTHGPSALDRRRMEEN